MNAMESVLHGEDGFVRRHPSSEVIDAQHVSKF